MKENKNKPEDSSKLKIYEALTYNDKDVSRTLQLVKDKSNQKEKKTILVESKNSFSFRKNKNEESLDTICRVFKLNKKSIESDFKDAISKFEADRIRVVHSSSLCAFLHFYNVSKKNPIYIDKVKYTKVYFEVKNDVFTNEKSNPSNVDLVLKSIDKKKLLFLECKFSEYFEKKSSLEVDSKYEQEYLNILDSNRTPLASQNKNIKTCLIYYDKGKEKKYIKISLKDEKTHYIDGIKQMISHYLGVCNFIKKEKDNENRIKLNDYEVELATILFDSDKWDKAAISDYKTQYNNLATFLNEDISRKGFKKFKVRVEKDEDKGILTYQKIFNNKDNKDYYDKLTDEIKKFYQYKD